MGHCIDCRLAKEMDPNIRFHRFRYHLATGFVSPSDTVIDLGSGSGYGSSLLGTKAKMVVGFEKEESEIIPARNKYGSDTIEFRCENLEESPLIECDVAVGFEVFEHLYKPEEFFRKLSNLVRKYIIFSVPVGQKLIWVEDAKEYQEEHDSTHKSAFETGRVIVENFESFGWKEFYSIQIGVTFLGIIYNPKFINE